MLSLLILSSVCHFAILLILSMPTNCASCADEMKARSAASHPVRPQSVARTNMAPWLGSLMETYPQDQQMLKIVNKINNYKRPSSVLNRTPEPDPHKATSFTWRRSFFCSDLSRDRLSELKPLS